MNPSADQRLLVISPVRNEEKHFERVALAMAAQTRRPDAWVVVDDGSTDRTTAILARLTEQIAFMNVCKASATAAGPLPKDRLATAAAPRAFNRGLESVDWRSFTHVAKLDGDVELPPDYFELLLARFRNDPLLGLAGGVRTERTKKGWRIERPPPDYHVPGGLKCYTLRCFKAIGGIQEILGWDTIDEVYARMYGFRTHTFPDLVAIHHRPWGSADGALRGRARHGRCAYIAHYPLPWVIARAFKPQEARPRSLSAVCYVGGYCLAALRRSDRVQDPEFRNFVRRELAARALHAVKADDLAARFTPPPLMPAAAVEAPAPEHGEIRLQPSGIAEPS